MFHRISGSHWYKVGLGQQALGICQVFLTLAGGLALGLQYWVAANLCL
jgi:hypothetical protein